MNTHHVTSKTVTGIKLYTHNAMCVEQHNRKTCMICTIVVWLGSPAAIVLLSLLHAYVTICKLTTWGMHNMYKKHKTHPDSEIVCYPSSSPPSMCIRTGDL